MLSNLLSRKVTIVRRSASGDTDAYGDNDVTETKVETIGELQQRGRAGIGGRSEVEDVIGVSDWLLILPAGTELDTNDVIEVDGDRYEVQGPSWHVRNPRTGEESHVEASLKRTEGESVQAPIQLPDEIEEPQPLRRMMVGEEE